MPTTPTLSPSAPRHLAAVHYSPEAAEALPPHMRPGGPVRSALLLHLAQHPEGVSESQLMLVAMAACGRRQAPPETADMRVICGHLAAQGLLVCELGNTSTPLYLSPPARSAARLRRLHGYTLPAIIQPAKVTE